jgi:hypothetical protein
MTGDLGRTTRIFPGLDQRKAFGLLSGAFFGRSARSWGHRSRRHSASGALVRRPLTCWCCLLLEWNALALLVVVPCATLPLMHRSESVGFLGG